MNKDEQIQRHVADVIKEWRKAREMSQATLAKKLGMHQTAIAKMENAERRIDFATAVQIAQILGIPWDEMYVEKPDDVDLLKNALITYTRYAATWISGLTQQTDQFENLAKQFMKFSSLAKTTDAPEGMTEEEFWAGIHSVTELQNTLMETAPKHTTSDFSNYMDRVKDVQFFVYRLKGKDE